MAGPATNVATMGAIYRGFGSRNLAIYLGVIIIGSIGFGAAFDLGVDSGLMSAPVTSHEHASWWAMASAIALSLLLARLAILDGVRWLRARRADAHESRLQVDVIGMTCGGCVRKLEAALLAVEGVVSAVVTRNPDRAIVVGSIDRARIDRAILVAGYQAD